MAYVQVDLIYGSKSVNKLIVISSVTVGSDKSLNVWNLRAGTPLQTFKIQTKPKRYRQSIGITQVNMKLKLKLYLYLSTFKLVKKVYNSGSLYCKTISASSKAEGVLTLLVGEVGDGRLRWSTSSCLALNLDQRISCENKRTSPSHL